MARFIDLDDGDDGARDEHAAIAALDQQQLKHARNHAAAQHQTWVKGKEAVKDADTADAAAREPERVWNAITEAFNCWP
jgi:hypothetical protein